MWSSMKVGKKYFQVRQTRTVLFTPGADAFFPFFYTPLSPYSSRLSLTNHHQSIHLTAASLLTVCKMTSRRCGLALPENTFSPHSYYFAIRAIDVLYLETGP